MKDENKKKKHRSKLGLFNFQIFLESVKSNLVSFLCVTLGNAFIAVVVILILSTLSINVTKDSMKNMFNSAKMETTLKQGSSVTFLSYYEGIEMYEEVIPFAGEAINGYYKLSYNACELCYDKNKINAFDIIEGAYDLTYVSPTNKGTPEEKHEVAKTSVSDLSKKVLEYQNYNDFEIHYVEILIDTYLDEHFKDNDKTTETLLFKSIPLSAKIFAESYLNLDSSLSKFIYTSIDDMLKTYDNKTSLSEYGRKSTINVIDDLCKFLGIDFTLSDGLITLLDAYILNEDAYTNNTILEGHEIGYKDETYIETISKVFATIIKENYYLVALEPFVVNYLTNELGEPYYINEDDEMVVIKDMKDRNKMIQVKDGMGKASNILEKRNKEILTGEPYTKEALEKANRDSESFYDLGYALVKDFLNLYIKDKSIYFDESSKSIKQEEVIKKVSENMEQFAEPIILKTFEVSSIDELTKDKYGIDGKEILEQVSNYSLSAITVFSKEFNKCQEKEYSLETSVLVSIVKSSKSVVDELPEEIYVKLYDLVDRNLYGLVLGIIFYAMAGLLLPMVFAVATANSLVAQQVENGSLAFTMSAPIKRREIIVSKALYLISSITAMYLVLFTVSLISREIGIAMGCEDFIVSFTVRDIALYHLGAYMVILAISSICFFTSTWFNKTKYSVGIGGGITIFFLISSILGMFGLQEMPLAIRIESMNFFNYLTIIRLFDVQGALMCEPIYFYKLLILLAIVIVFYVTAIIKFERKDLPL